MNPLISVISICYFLFSGQFGNQIITTSVKIKLSKMSEIEQLVQLGLKADGYVLTNKYWLIDLTERELELLEKSSFVYEQVAPKTTVELAQNVSFLKGTIKTVFDPCGYQLHVSYNLSNKLSFLSIQVFDLEGKQYIKRLGYNMPADNYESKISSDTWPDNIYLVQLTTYEKEKIQKVIQKSATEKKI